MSYGIWHYVHLTDDKAFLYRYGAEMLLQIARFQATRVGFSEKIGKYGFFGVMGPDEFHMMVNNNAYTNYMGMRALRYAADVMDAMRADAPEAYAALCEKSSLHRMNPRNGGTLPTTCTFRKRPITCLSSTTAF